MSAAGPKESVESVDREPDLDIYDKLRRFDEKIKELEARLAPRVPHPVPASDGAGLVGVPSPKWQEPGLPGAGEPCEERSSGFFGNAALAAPNETRECEGCGQRKPLEEMAVCFLPGTGESYQCEECRGGP